MIAIVAALALSASPHSASLLNEPPAIGTGILLAGDALPPPPPGLAQPKTLQQLRDERAALDATRPSVGGPVAMLAVGAGLCLFGVAFGIVGLELLVLYLFTGSSLGYLGTVFTVMGFVFAGLAVVAIAVGIPLAVVGGIRLKKTVNERSKIGEEMNKLDEQMKQLEDLTPPAAPPPPPTVERERGPQPMILLATF